MVCLLKGKNGGKSLSMSGIINIYRESKSILEGAGWLVKRLELISGH